MIVEKLIKVGGVPLVETSKGYEYQRPDGKAKMFKSDPADGVTGWVVVYQHHEIRYFGPFKSKVEAAKILASL